MRTKFKIGLGISLAAVFFCLAVKDSPALTVVPLKLSQIVNQNVNGVSFNGTVTNVDYKCRAGNGMACFAVTWTVNSVIKGDLQAGNSVTYRFASGLGIPVPEVNKTYIVSLYNPSPQTGLTSYVGFSQGLFPVDAEGNAAANTAMLRLKTLSISPSASAEQKNLQTKSLTNVQSINGRAKVQASDLENVMRGLVNGTIVQP